MKPFRLDVELRAPLAGADIPTLDAVLLGELARLQPDAPDYARSPADAAADPARAAAAALTLKDPLTGEEKPLLKITNGIPHASALLFDAGLAAGRFVKTNRRTRELDAIVPLGLKSGIGGMSHSSGPYAPSLSAVSHRMVGDAQFLGVGDIAGIARVLRCWRGVGAQWRNGWGEIGAWQIVPQESADPAAWGLVEDGRPLRPLPRRFFVEKLGGDPAHPVVHRRVVPPYWSAKTPRVPAVVPDERRPILSAPAAVAAPGASADDDESVANFMLRRFAVFMMPKSERAKFMASGGAAAVVARALSRNYQHREKRNDKGDPSELRLGDSAVAVVAEDQTLLLSHAVPAGEADDSFRALPPEEGKTREKISELLWAAAMTPGAGPRVILQFRKKGVGDIFMFSAASDCAAVSGENAGTLYRSAIRRILAVARKGGMNVAALKKWRDEENRRRRDPEAAEAALARMEKERTRRGLSEDEWFDLQELLPAVTAAGWAVLNAAPAAPPAAPPEEE